MNHIFFGSCIPFAVFLLVYLLRRCRASFRMLWASPLLMALGATWAVIPDLPRIVGWTAMDRRLASTQPWIDVFFFHYTINRHETVNPVFSVLFVLMLLVLLAAAWKELYRMENR